MYGLDTIFTGLWKHLYGSQNTETFKLYFSYYYKNDNEQT